MTPSTNEVGVTLSSPLAMMFPRRRMPSPMSVTLPPAMMSPWQEWSWRDVSRMLPSHHRSPLKFIREAQLIESVANSAISEAVGFGAVTVL